ncbi:MAG: Hint domain-containing protein [Octadecabacter sp.]|nr:Hint domain-containing protein [Octadecabacter sp.]
MQGETAIEDLAVGYVIVTASGRAVGIKRVGRQTVDKRLCGPKMEPVRIRAGALGHGLPHSDLIVTADHGMILDNLLINASALVNGTTIAFVPLSELPALVTCYHIEIEPHDVILANGAPSETFVDAVGRAAFDNFRE